jgi:hypothetical protein
MEKKREKSLAPAGNRNTAILPVPHFYTDSVTPALMFTQVYICYLERGPLSLVSTAEELLDRKVAAPV